MARTTSKANSKVLAIRRLTRVNTELKKHINQLTIENNRLRQDLAITRDEVRKIYTKHYQRRRERTKEFIGKIRESLT
jgi:hypothetical protein